MDSPGLDRASHLQALDALARVNAVSFTANRIWTEIARIHRASGGAVRVLDVACGGGDVLAAIGRRAGRSGIPVELAGCDASPFALEETRRRCGNVPVETLELDVVGGALPEGFDLIASSLFLHHLDMGEAEALLAAMAAAARRAVLVQDLRRTRLGYAFAWIGLHTLTTSAVARIDGLRSVRGAFTSREARTLCQRAGLRDAQVLHAWPQRFVIRWERG